MDSIERSGSIAQLHGLAGEERLAHPYDDKGAICKLFDLIEERVRARAVSRRRSQLLVAAAALLGSFVVAVFLLPRSR